jgi:hypothetical protein
MPKVFAQSIVVNDSVSDHPLLWGAAICVTAWLLLRPRQ